MSKLTGHWQITKEAIKQLIHSENAAVQGGENTIALSRLHAQDLATAVIVRDLADVANGGHWGNYGQSHHFMRKFNGQSQFEAYQDGVNWIQKNALVASKKLYKVILASKDARDKRERPAPAFWVEELGFACHAIQDSFADGHAIREQATTANAPGRIARVLKYAGADMEGHSEYDTHWESSKKGATFTLKGRLAVNATKEIISMVILTATEQVKNGTPPVSLSGWSTFKNRWLVASPLLSKKRDVVVMHCISEVKKKGGGQQLLAIKKDTKLLALFKDILTTGWTTESEKNALSYLTGIK